MFRNSTPARLVLLLAALWLQGASYSVWAQNTENKQPVGSVNADPGMKPGSGSGQEGLSNLYSLSLYDGTANIRIPIYQYEAEGADFGIAFTYNTRGVTVNEWASPVGLHWNLTSGAISRTVKGQPDELNVIADDSVDVPPPLGSPNGSWTRTYANRFTRFRGKFACYGETPAQAADTRTFRDRESDEFQVSAANCRSASGWAAMAPFLPIRSDG